MNCPQCKLKDREELLKALAILHFAIKDLRNEVRQEGDGVEDAIEKAALQQDILSWVLGHPSKFAAFYDESAPHLIKSPEQN